MIWICIALLVLAELILAEESNVQPNLQVQHFTSLINGAILAEGVITNKIKIDDMTTDWMILDSMPRNKDWISSLDSNGQFGPFLDVIKNGFKKNFPMDQLENIVKLTKAVQSVPKLAVSSQKVLETFHNHLKTFTVDLVRYNQTVQFISFLPLAIPHLRSASKNQEIVKHIQSGLNFINAFKNIDINKINESLHLCSKYDGTLRAFYPCDDIHTEIQKIGETPNVKDMEILAFFIRTYHYAESSMQGFNALFDEISKLVAQRKKLQDLLPALTSFSKIPDGYVVADIFKIVKELKKDDAKLKSLIDALDELETMSEVVSRISNYNPADKERKIKSSNRFNLYRGFPNGTESLRGLIAVLGSENILPSKYRRSKLLERINSIKGWQGKMTFSDLLENARGLIGLHEVFSNSQVLSKFAGKTDFQGYDTSLYTLLKFLKSVSIGKVSEAINTLIDIEKRVELFEKSEWIKPLHSDMTRSGLLSNLQAWDQLFWPILNVFNIFVQVREDFKELRESGLKIEKAEIATLTKVHKAIMSHMDSYINSIPVLLKYFKTVQRNKDLLALEAENINGMKDKLAVLNNIDDKNWCPSDSLSMDQLQGRMISYTELKKNTNGVSGLNTTHLEKFLHDLKDVEVLKKFILPLPASFDLTTTKTLLETLAASSIGEIPAISGKANGILSSLMAGDPFGSEVLQDLSTGVSAFHNLVRDIDLSKLAGELAAVRDDAEANDAIGKLVDGAEFVQIPADPSNVYSMFADDVNLPQHVKKLSVWISRILEADHQTEKAYLEENKGKFGTLHALIHRVEKPMDAEFKLLSDRIEFIFRVLQDDGKLGSGSIIIIVVVVLLIIGLILVGGFIVYKRLAKNEEKNANQR